MPGRAVVWFCVLSWGCGPDYETSTTWEASRWREADSLFESDARWLGADAAYSVDLGGDRTLWLFGDSFVAESEPYERENSVFVRNSIGIQTGRNPVGAEMEFYWRHNGSEPASFVPEEGERWFWPLHGLRRNGELTLFFMLVEQTGVGLGFGIVGTRAFRIPNPSSPPLDWVLEELALPTFGFALIYGVALVDRGTYLYGYAMEERGDRPAYVLRWPGEDFDAGQLEGAEIRSGESWVPLSGLPSPPSSLFVDAHTEFSVSERPSGEFVLVTSLGFGSTTIGLRTAPRPWGPFTEAETVFEPSESGDGSLLVYAGKAHGQLEGAGLVATYAANAMEFRDLIRRTDIYYPRFVRIEPIR